MIEYENLSFVNKEFRVELQKCFNASLDSGKFILSRNVEKFENNFSRYINSKYSCGVASGLDAIILSLFSLNLDKDAEIIVPSNTYIATILAILRCGLKPVLVEPDMETYNICPENITQKINKKTKAVIVTHLYGSPCDMAKIVDICKTNNLYLLEDCAQSHGAKYKNKSTGTFGDFGCFSFYPTKNLGALGDGGLISIKNLKRLELLQSLRNYGSKKKYENSEIGFNSRLDEIQAAFLNIKLKKIDKLIKHKQKLAKIYYENIKDEFIKPKILKNCRQVFHIFPIRHPKRNQLRKFLLKNGISTEIHYPIPPHMQKGYKNILKGKFPISEEIHKTILSLPISSMHNEDHIYKVCESLNKF